MPQNNLISSVEFQNRSAFMGELLTVTLSTPTIFNGIGYSLDAFNGKRTDKYGKSCNKSTKLSITYNHINYNKFKRYEWNLKKKNNNKVL